MAAPINYQSDLSQLLTPQMLQALFGSGNRTTKESMQGDTAALQAVLANQMPGTTLAGNQALMKAIFQAGSEQVPTLLAGANASGGRVKGNSTAGLLQNDLMARLANQGALALRENQQAASQSAAQIANNSRITNTTQKSSGLLGGTNVSQGLSGLATIGGLLSKHGDKIKGILGGGSAAPAVPDAASTAFSASNFDTLGASTADNFNLAGGGSVLYGPTTGAFDYAIGATEAYSALDAAAGAGDAYSAVTAAGEGADALTTVDAASTGAEAAGWFDDIASFFGFADGGTPQRGRPQMGAAPTVNRSLALDPAKLAMLAPLELRRQLEEGTDGSISAPTAEGNASQAASVAGIAVSMLGGNIFSALLSMAMLEANAQAADSQAANAQAASVAVDSANNYAASIASMAGEGDGATGDGGWGGSAAGDAGASGFSGGDGGGDGEADGGLITGAGTGTSDSIPTRLSNKEYVLSADVVQALGIGLLDKLQAQFHRPVNGRTK